MNIYDRQHNKSMGDCAKRVEEIIAAYEKKIMGIITRSGINPDDGFKFSDHPALKRECDKLIKELSNNIRITIEKAEKTEWERSNDKNDKLVSEVVKSASAAKNMGYMQRNLDAMEAFIGRKIAGMNLSQRVWNITKQFRGQMEAAVDIALQDHRTADELSRDVRQYLRYPDKLFRRVRDEKGVLHLSKAAKAFHPGRGVYRSSYMNARRLAATEINMAYRTSDDTRRQQLDFVVGIEVHLSNNHNCKGIPEGEFRDICDKLQGKYPKTFKFVGWHPHCRCYATSILKTREEVMEDIERRKKGLKPVKSVNEVKDVPDGFKEWVDQNQERIAKANSLPYFLRDNGQMVDGQWVMNEMAPEPSLLDNAQQRHSMRTPEQIKDIKERWKKRNEVIKGYETTKKRAGNILNMEKEWSEVSFEQLRKAMDAVSDKSVYRASDYAELKKMLQDTIQKIKQQQTAEKALSDVIPDVHKWHKQFTLAELGDVRSAVEKKIAEYGKYGRDKDLSYMKDKLEFEADWVKRHKKYSTWEVAEESYKRKMMEYADKIEWKDIDDMIKQASSHGHLSDTYGKYVSTAINMRKNGARKEDIKNILREAEKERMEWMDIDKRIMEARGYVSSSKKFKDALTEAESLRKNGASKSEIEKYLKEAEDVRARNEASKRSKAAIAAKAAAAKLAEKKQRLQDEIQGLKSDISKVESRISSFGGKALSAKDRTELDKLKEILEDYNAELAVKNAEFKKISGGYIHKTLDELKVEMGAKLPKTLENLDKAIEKYNTNGKVNPDFVADRDNIEEVLRKMFEENDLGMDISGKLLDSVFENGFYNTFQSGTSDGYCGSRSTKGKIPTSHSRLRCAHRLFGLGRDLDKDQLKRSEYEKYGHLLDHNKLEAFKNNRTHYGTGDSGRENQVQIRFKRENVTCTWTFNDSLGERYQPTLVSDPKIESLDYIDKAYKPIASDTKKLYEWQQKKHTSYVELQYHGDLTIDDVESIVFARNPERVISTSLISKLKSKGIELYYYDGSNIVAY